MKFNLQALLTNLHRHVKTFVIGFAILTLVWQGAILGVSPAIASPLFAASASSISKQVTGKVEEMKGSATKSVGKAQSAIEDRASDAKMKVKDNLTEAKVKIESNNIRTKNSADKVTDKVKNFFGQ